MPLTFNVVNPASSKAFCKADEKHAEVDVVVDRIKEDEASVFDCYSMQNYVSSEKVRREKSYIMKINRSMDFLTSGI